MLASYAKWYSFTPPQRPNFPPPLTPAVIAMPSCWSFGKPLGWEIVACSRNSSNPRLDIPQVFNKPLTQLLNGCYC